MPNSESTQEVSHRADMLGLFRPRRLGHLDTCAALFCLVFAGVMPACSKPASQDKIPTHEAKIEIFQQALEPDQRWLSTSFQIPADSTLLDDLAGAIDFRAREDFDRLLDAYETGELLEHASLSQLAIDRGIFGLDDLFVFGDELFEYEFRPEHGLGNALGPQHPLSGDAPAPNLRRVQQGEFGGPDSLGCSTCHLKGGPDGAGNLTQNAYFRSNGDNALGADERNPPHVLGLGPIQALANEMSRELQALRDATLARAIDEGMPRSVALTSKGISFGTLQAQPDGSLNTEFVEGIDADLTVRPFGWKGHQATIRGMAEESFRIHLGIVSMELQKKIRDGLLDAEDYGTGPWYDIDDDGTTIELEDGMLTTMVAYLAQLEAPVIRPPQPPGLADRFARGRLLFDELGCGSCHPARLELIDPVIELRPTEPEHADRESIRLHVAHDGEHPKIEPQNVLETAYYIYLHSDLKRHDMGEELAAPMDQGHIPAATWLTRPLWGLAETAPYLHDGRAPTVDDAIRLHGGEAAAARDAYIAADEESRGSVLVYLLSLTRSPKLFVP